jgi:aryl-phospho-beta-D-glucosidase BglC (GH1 family)
MKNIKTFEDYHYSKDDIKNMLLKAQKKSQIDLKVNVDELLSTLEDPLKDRFGFNAIVREEARFLSESDYKNMGEYIQKFKELGLNTIRIEKLYPKLQKYKKIQIRDMDYARTNSEINRLNSILDKLQPYVDELVEEVKRLAKEAKKIIYDN